MLILYLFFARIKQLIVLYTRLLIMFPVPVIPILTKASQMLDSHRVLILLIVLALRLLHLTRIQNPVKIMAMALRILLITMMFPCLRSVSIKSWKQLFPIPTQVNHTWK